MFSATPAKKPHARASASVRRSQSRAASVAASAAGSPQPEGSTSRGGPGAAERRRTIASGNGQHAGYSGSVLQEETPQDVAEMETMGILLKTETHAVSLYGGSLPQEVTALLSHGSECTYPGSELPRENSFLTAAPIVTLDFYTDPYAAELDHASGYACLIGRERCYVWSLSRVSRAPLVAARRMKLRQSLQSRTSSRPSAERPLWTITNMLYIPRSTSHWRLAGSNHLLSCPVRCLREPGLE